MQKEFHTPVAPKTDTANELSNLLEGVASQNSDSEVLNLPTSSKVVYNVLYRPGTRLCVGTKSDIQEVQEVLRQLQKTKRQENPNDVV